MAPTEDPGTDPNEGADAGALVRLGRRDRDRIRAVVNAAARAYEGVIPAEHYSEPYMGADELAEALDAMEFFGVERAGKLVGVMGFQAVDDVRLIRHLYVRPDHQRQGVGSRLLAAGIDRAGGRPLLVGTWAAAKWAVRFYEANGFENLGNERRLFDRYWEVGEAHAAASVVLRYTNGSSADRKES